MANVIQAHTFVTNEVLTAATMNANPAAFVAGFANIDHFNIGAAGIYASQMIPSNNAQAQFGGAQTYVFGTGVSTGTTPLQVNAPNGTVVNAFDTQINSVSKFAVDSTGRAVSTVSLLAPGGTAGGYLLTTAAGFGYTGGTGAPTHSAPNGTLWSRYDNSTSPVYVNTSGASTSGTTWTAITTGTPGVYSAQNATVVAYTTLGTESNGTPGVAGTVAITLPNSSPGANGNWRAEVRIVIGGAVQQANQTYGIGSTTTGSAEAKFFNNNGTSTHTITGGNCISDSTYTTASASPWKTITSTLYSAVYANSSALSFNLLIGTTHGSVNDVVTGLIQVVALPN